MREDRLGDAFRLTPDKPDKLCADRRMSGRDLSTPSRQRPNDARTVADVERHATERSLLIANCRHVGGMEQHRPSHREPIANRGSTDGVLQVECLPRDGAEAETVTRFDGAPLGDRIAANPRRSRA